MISYERAKEIAEDFLHKMNPDMWNGDGLLPPNVDTRVVSYDIGSRNGNRLDISIVLDPVDGWCHYCELVDEAANELIIPLTGYGIDSVSNLVDTILDVCMDDHRNRISGGKIMQEINDYGIAKDHDERSEELYQFISDLDFKNGDEFYFKDGGDGDNGEMLMDLLDAYFANKKQIPESDDGWIPVSSGRLPKEYVSVQATFIGYNDGNPYCDMFVRLYNGKWYWAYDDEEVKVEIIAWKPVGEPYKGE